MAVDFRAAEPDVTSVSIWMGALATGRLLAMIKADPEKLAYLRDQIETPEFTGRVIRVLYPDPTRAELNGPMLIGAEFARKYASPTKADANPLRTGTRTGSFLTSTTRS